MLPVGVGDADVRAEGQEQLPPLEPRRDHRVHDGVGDRHGGQVVDQLVVHQRLQRQVVLGEQVDGRRAACGVVAQSGGQLLGLEGCGDVDPRRRLAPEPGEQFDVHLRSGLVLEPPDQLSDGGALLVRHPHAERDDRVGGIATEAGLALPAARGDQQPQR